MITLMLKLLRRFAKPDGRLFYTLFIDEESEGGHGLMTSSHARCGSRRSGVTGSSRARHRRSREPVPFPDVSPTSRSSSRMYSREHALELVEGTGWQVIDVFPPDVHLQHHIVCAPR